MIRKQSASILVLAVVLTGSLLLQGCGAAGNIGNIITSLISGVSQVLSSSNVMDAVQQALGAAGNIAGMFGANDVTRVLGQVGQAVQGISGALQGGPQTVQNMANVFDGNTPNAPGMLMNDGTLAGGGNNWTNAINDGLAGGAPANSSRGGGFAPRGGTGAGGQRLAGFYGSPGGYQQVNDDVMNWFGTTRNGCVAFMSSALRQAGYDVPQDGGVSTVTRPFSDYLEGQLGFQRVSNPGGLQSGDVVFTQDGPGDPGYPSHTYMFQGWADRGQGLANVVDNQGSTHVRNVGPNGGATPFQYALRPN